MSDSSPFTYQLNQTEAGYLSLLLGIIQSQNWEALGCAIYRNPATFQLFAATPHCGGDAHQLFCYSIAR